MSYSIIPKSVSVDNVTLETNASGEIQIKKDIILLNNFLQLHPKNFNNFQKFSTGYTYRTSGISSSNTEFEIIAKPGEYEIIIIGSTSNSSGIFSIYINNIKETEIDFYTSTYTNQTELTTTINLVEGLNKIRFVNETKNINVIQNYYYITMEQFYIIKK